MAKPNRLPQMSLHAASGQARVLIEKKSVYLGKFGSVKAEQNYRALMRQYIADGYRWTAASLGDQPPAPTTTAVVTAVEIANAYAEHARSVYVKRDKPTTTAIKARLVAELLTEFDDQRTPALEFGPRRLTEFQAWLVKRDRWVRCTVNEYVQTVVTMYRWAASMEKIPESQWMALKAVRGVAKGRPPAPGLPKPREGRKVTGVPITLLEPVRRKAPTHLRAMIDLQLATGMRPGEVVTMRPMDLSPTRDPHVMAYRVIPDTNKTDHHEIDRIVYLGPKARAILAAHQPERDDAYYFDPAACERRRMAKRSAARTTPKYAAHDLHRREKAARARGVRPATRGAKYRVDSYRIAVRRLCDAVFPHPVLAEIPTSDLTQSQFAELKAWRKKHRWSPHQLRHSAATTITRAEKIDVAQLMLGHADIETTLRYVDPDDERALAAAVKYG